MLLLRPSLQQSGPFVHPPCSELLYLCGGMQPELLSTPTIYSKALSRTRYGRHVHVEEGQCSLPGGFLHP